MIVAFHAFYAVGSGQLHIVGVVEVRPDLVELECNPVLARPVGAITVDALAIVVN